MKYLITLLFLFSNYSFSNSLDGKSLFCKDKDDIGYLSYNAYMFLKDKVIYLSIGLNNDKYFIRKTYSTNSKHIYIRIHPRGILQTINRETLTKTWSVQDLDFISQCSVFVNDKSLMSKFDEIINKFQFKYDEYRKNNKI